MITPLLSAQLVVAASALQYGPAWPSCVPISMRYHVARVPTSVNSHATSGCLSLVRRARYPVAVGTTTKAAPKPTAVYALILANLLIFFSDKILRLPLPQYLYLYHSQPMWFQPLTSTLCHASREHLSGNLFLLLLFGRSVEDELGWFGLLAAYAFCGVVASMVSLLLLPRATVSLGASGAVFGLFAVSTLSKLTWRDLDWRKLCEVAVLGEFVLGKVLAEIQTAATGGVAGVNHVAHLSGAVAGTFLVVLLRAALHKMEPQERKVRQA